MVIPKLYDGRNKTFFMAAYEGVRAEVADEPVQLGPDGADAPGELLRDQHADPESVHAARRSPGNIIPPSMLSKVALELLQYYRRRTPGTAVSNLQNRRSNKDNIDQFSAACDQNVGNKIRLYVRYNWHDSLNTNIGAIPATGSRSRA